MNDCTANETVCVVSTGGTFEKMYDPVLEHMAFSGVSIVPHILSEAGVENVPFRQIAEIDSLKMTDEERSDIISYVLNLEFRRVVIIHGTSSLLTTARLIQNANPDGVYIFTGAIVPFRYRKTEASFNLGGAIALARCIARGVFVYMHGEIFDPAFAEKDSNKLRFIHVAPSRDPKLAPA
jgi:L-asparaginase